MKWWQKKVKGWTVPFWYSDKHYHRLINKIEDKKRGLFLLGGTL